ncbi:class I SAM-dependent methyltransferase [Candidatus Woesearchaeota archaeon]|nr:class I SAM-dependent methyltransferase [Candidatus Woesearchaeota archaeon]
MDYKDYVAGQIETNFWFRSKDNLLNTLLLKIKRKNLKILDIGVGTGDYLDILNKYGKVYVIDISKEALSLIPDKKCKKKKLSYAQKIKYPANFFDVVVSLDVFEHIDDDFLAVSEAFRVLKNGGYLIFNIPAIQSLFSAHDRALKHRRRYSKKSTEKLMKKFKIIQIEYWNSFLFLPVLIKRKALHKSKKSKIDKINLPPILDQLFYVINCLELYLIKKGISMPFGTSLFGICKKEN